MEEKRKIVFETLSKGIIVSKNSKKHMEVAAYLSDEDNFEEFNSIIQKLGFYLIGENGYFYLTKSLKIDEENKIYNSYKQIILSIVQLKKAFIHMEKGYSIQKTNFIQKIKSKKDEEILISLFNVEDVIEATQKLFKLLEANYILENYNGDKYLVLNAIDYFLDIVNIISEEEE